MPVGPSIAYIPLTKGLFALIDREDADWAGGFNWCALTQRNGPTYAACAALRLKSSLLHKALFDSGDGLVTDHKNGNGLDNRRSNLRAATNSQNQFNSKQHADSSSPYKGVYWVADISKWGAKIGFNWKTKSLGFFETPEEAHAAYSAAAVELHGEFARVA